MIKNKKYKFILNVFGVLAVLGFCYLMHLRSNNKIKDNAAFAIGVTTHDLIHKGHTRRIFYEFIHNQKKYKNYYSENILSKSADLTVPGGLYLVVFDSLHPKSARLDIHKKFESKIEGDSIINNGLILEFSID